MLAIAAALFAGMLTPALAQRSDQASRYYEDAVKRYEKSDLSGAIVQLKNALQQDPNLLVAHVLLGKAQIAQGDPAGAEASFERALQLGVDRSEIALPMARALLALGKHRELLERLPPAAVPQSQRPELLMTRGQAYGAIGDTASERRAYEDARALDRGYVPAILALAELDTRAGKRSDASKLIDEAMAIAPQDAGVWYFKGRLALGAGDVQAALDAFAKAIGIDPDHVDARIGRATLLMDLGRLDEAEPDVEYLRLHSPREPRAIYVRALSRAKRGDARGTRDAMEELTRAIDPAPIDVLQKQAPELLLLGGLAHFSLGEPEKARRYLDQYIVVRPNDVGARRLLASVLLGMRDERAAITHLDAALKRAPNDPQLLALLGAAYMGRGQLNIASRYLEDALKASGGAPEVETTLGFNLLGRGEGDLAIHYLQEAFRKDPGQGRAGVALVALHIRRGQFKEAVEVARAVVKRQPGNAEALNLLGVASVAAGDAEAARAAYTEAIAANTSFAPAQLNLAKLDVAEGDYAAARAVLEGLLKQEPRNTSAMYELAVAEQAAGNDAAAIRWLEKARAIERNNVRAASRLVDIYVATKAPDKALEVAKDIAASLPENLEALAVLGRAYLALGNEKEAQTALGRMARLAAFDPSWQTEIARYQLAANNLPGAIFSAEKALSGQPDYLPAQVLLAEIDLRRGEIDKAEERARTIAKQMPRRADGHRLLGDVAMARKRYPQAREQYRIALDKQPTTDAAVRLFVAHVESGDAAGGIKVLEAWLRAHPQDRVAQRALAEGYLRAGNLAAAQARYEQLVKDQGDDAALLNNLANLLQLRKDPKAVEYAERAHALQPKDASIQDTLGWALVEQGQLERGIRELRDARLRDPQNPEIRYHLASALARAGRPEEARRELEPAMQEGLRFASRDGAVALWRSLAVR
ncbi:MAG: PEP-CTERM system TPR-repeat protein PrsT [Burkholderiales bacterium]|nr:PEP-CTERM system TPR-repeat protein PrsT [Burkholderiales bacterium]